MSTARVLAVADRPGASDHDRVVDLVRVLVAAQDGVISRAQAKELELTDATRRRQVRRREWARVHPRGLRRSHGAAHRALTDGVVIHRVVGLETRTMWNTSPPRMRVEEAVLDLAATARTHFAAIAVISQAVQARRTTAQRVLATATRRTRLGRRRRSWRAS